MTTIDDSGLQRIARFWDARGREDARRYSVPGGCPIDEPAYAASGEAFVAAAEGLVGWVPGSTDVVADVGCGAGRITGALAPRVEHVFAYDVSAAMLEVARDRLPDAANVTWRRNHAADLALQEAAAVDAVVLLGVLTRLPDIESITDVLGEASRIVEPDGVVLFDVRTAPLPLLLPGEATVPPYVADHPLWRGCTVELETLAAIAHQQGLEIERIAGSETGRCLVLARGR